MRIVAKIVAAHHAFEQNLDPVPAFGSISFVDSQSTDRAFPEPDEPISDSVRRDRVTFFLKHGIPALKLSPSVIAIEV
jgi:hypothetical protein